MDKYSTRKHLQSFVVVLEYVRAVLAKSEALSERSEFSICRNENSRQTQPRKLPVWRCGPPALPNLINIPE